MHDLMHTLWMGGVGNSRKYNMFREGGITTMMNQLHPTSGMSETELHIWHTYGMTIDQYNAVADGCDSRRKSNLINYGTGNEATAQRIQQAEANHG